MKKTETRLKFVNCIKNFSNQTPNSVNWFQKQVIQNSKITDTFLKNNPDIYFTKADKSNTTVAMNKTKYIQEATLMLPDKKTYEPPKKDPTSTIYNKVNNIIKIWKSKNFINEKIAYSLKSSNPLPARFYGLPKIHKPNHPLRPIVSFCGSPTYNLASFYNDVISNNIIPPISRVKNSFDFAEKIKNLQVPPGYKIISLDAVSLFKNVQIGIAIKGMKDRWP